MKSCPCTSLIFSCGIIFAEQCALCIKSHLGRIRRCPGHQNEFRWILGFLVYSSLFFDLGCVSFFVAVIPHLVVLGLHTNFVFPCVLGFANAAHVC